MLDRNKSIIFFNDKYQYNDLYRGDLISKFLKNGFNVYSIGFNNLIFKLKIFFKNDNYLISSNLKANLFIILFFFKKKCTIIINGLGRFRGSKFFRFLIIFLFNFNSNKSYIFQNHADYRYFNKFIFNNHCFFILGSGGSKRICGQNRDILVIQRDGKLNLIKPSLIDYIKTFKFNKIFIIGCSPKKKRTIKKLGINVFSLGKVHQNKIFYNGNIFLQPDGYGEGFPHTLSDAIMSDMEIHINKKTFILLGLYKYDLLIKKLSDKWLLLRSTSKIKILVNKNKITSDYYTIINNSINF